MKQSFLLTWRALVRGHVLSLLLAATALVHLLLPALVRSDGTAAGWREMFVRAVPGTAFAVIALSVLVCACGCFAQERERFRLALAVVRPASLVGVACGRWLALCAVGAAALALSAALTALRVPDAPPCRHRHVPDLPPPAETARGILADYLRHPESIENPSLRALVTNAPAAALRVLANREFDRYEALPPGGRGVWPFSPDLAAADRPFVRVRFATQLDLTSSFSGRFELGDWSAVLSNRTQSVLDVPLVRAPAAAAAGAERLFLRFENTGSRTVMLRPRRDLEIHVPADAFAANLFRASVQMLAAVSLLAAFGLFLSSALSRPVAVFTALVALLVVQMAPAVAEQVPEEMQTSFADRVGLWLARGVALLASSAGEARPISDLATDTCIEWAALARGCAVNACALPCALLGLTAAFLRRRPLADRS